MLIPLAYLAVYVILYLLVRADHISDRTLRGACGLIFFGAATLLSGSVLVAIHDFAGTLVSPLRKGGV